MRSEWRSFPVATITFFGEQQDIIDPRRNADVPSRQRAVDDQNAFTRSVMGGASGDSLGHCPRSALALLESTPATGDTVRSAPRPR